MGLCLTFEMVLYSRMIKNHIVPCSENHKFFFFLKEGKSSSMLVQPHLVSTFLSKYLRRVNSVAPLPVACSSLSVKEHSCGVTAPQEPFSAVWTFTGKASTTAVLLG